MTLYIIASKKWHYTSSLANTKFGQMWGFVTLTHFDIFLSSPSTSSFEFSGVGEELTFFLRPREGVFFIK